MFQSLPWSQVYEVKHLHLQTAFINICERMGSQVLSGFHCGTVIGWLLNTPQSALSGIISGSVQEYLSAYLQYECLYLSVFFLLPTHPVSL